jgi:hypothetical protein
LFREITKIKKKNRQNFFKVKIIGSLLPMLFLCLFAEAQIDYIPKSLIDSLSTKFPADYAVDFTRQQILPQRVD